MRCSIYKLQSYHISYVVVETIQKNICESDDFFINNLDLNQRVVHFKNIGEINCRGGFLWNNTNRKKVKAGRHGRLSGVLKQLQEIHIRLSYLINPIKENRPDILTGGTLEKITEKLDTDLYI